MMASSPRAVFTRQRKITTRVYVTIISIILLSLSISVESSIHGVQESFTARVGDTVNIHFEYCARPIPSCTLEHSFNLSAPNPTCTVDRYGHCEVAQAPRNDPFREGMGMGCELCVLVIHEVTQKDAGRYAMCQTSGSCTSPFWRNISTLVVEEPPTPTGSTSTKVSTKPTTDSTKTTKPGDPPKNVSEINSLLGTDAPGDNNTRSGMSPSAVGIPITIVFLVILFIVGAVYFWKRRNRRQSTPMSPESPYADTTTVTITEGSPAVNNIQIANEVSRLRAESESDT